MNKQQEHTIDNQIQGLHDQIVILQDKLHGKHEYSPQADYYYNAMRELINSLANIFDSLFNTSLKDLELLQLKDDLPNALLDALRTLVDIDTYGDVISECSCPNSVVPYSIIRKWIDVHLTSGLASDILQVYLGDTVEQPPIHYSALVYELVTKIKSAPNTCNYKYFATRTPKEIMLFISGAVKSARKNMPKTNNTTDKQDPTHGDKVECLFAK